jgi:hypothetical protein
MHRSICIALLLLLPLLLIITLLIGLPALRLESLQATEHRCLSPRLSMLQISTALVYRTANHAILSFHNIRIAGFSQKEHTGVVSAKHLHLPLEAHDAKVCCSAALCLVTVTLAAYVCLPCVRR